MFVLGLVYPFLQVYKKRIFVDLFLVAKQYL